LIFPVLNKAIKQYLKYRYKSIILKSKNVGDHQIQLLNNLLLIAKNTHYGKTFDFNSIKDYDEYKKNVPLVKYDDVQSLINRMMNGENDVLWPGIIRYFSKSSGTTRARSKFLPISDTFLRSNLINSSWDTTAFIYNNDPDASIFHHKSLILGGSLHAYDENKNILVGDVSAIMINTIPLIGRPFYSPSMDIALMSNWVDKIEKIVEKCLDEDIVMLGGVPTWNMVLFNKILDQTGKKNILEIWPNLKYYLHGGVDFKPYRKMFERYVPRSDFNYIEVYNASEGYFAVQDDFNVDGMRLLTDNGIFYEFIELSEFNTDQAYMKAMTVEEVQIGVNYVIIITTSSGLWRYVIGDTVIFTDTNPFRLKVSGRIEQFINAFGEEVMICNTDRALAETIEEYGLHVHEYTVAPYIPDGNEAGYHDWLIEFESSPENLSAFSERLDRNLRKLNSDYDAKRMDDMAMINLKVQAVKNGSFYNWLRVKNKLGGQYKIPRLQNDRILLNEILSNHD
jgi:hypothetical protein